MGSGSVTILGCGGSGGVPLIGNYWGDCDPDNPKNNRLRSSIAIHYGDNQKETLIVDTGTDFRQQVNRYDITNINGVMYTHVHSDHVNGIDELRYLSFVQERVIPVYGTQDVLEHLMGKFHHMFQTSPNKNYKPVLEAELLKPDDFYTPIDVQDLPVTLFKQGHGYGETLGFRFGNLAYSTDVSSLDDKAFDVLAGIDTWIVDCGQFFADWVLLHPNIDVVRKWNDKIKAKRVILTHLTPRVDYEKATAACPKGFEIAYDGQRIDFDL